MNRKDEFNKWYDEYFLDIQGEDSPYSYEDVKNAFYKGYETGRKGIENANNN